MNERSLKIGITIGLRTPDESIWVNGIKQNAIFLAKLFKSSSLNHEVYLLNTTNIAISNQLPWDICEYKTLQFDEMGSYLDVIIELGGQINLDQTRRIKSAGTKLVSYCCGAEYTHTVQNIIFNSDSNLSLFINQQYDEIWVIPQVYRDSVDYFRILRRAPARIVPFVWDPLFLDVYCRNLPNNGEYTPGREAKRISIIEPNISTNKFCLYPILAVECIYREHPNRVEGLLVANSERFVLNETVFSSIMRNLDIVNAGKARFIGRVITPEFIAKYTDVIISHQCFLPLNYMYLECCWQGYPLVHNAHLVSDIGYFYSTNDMAAATKQLKNVLFDHDDRWIHYRSNQRKIISQFLPTNTDLINEYDHLLLGLFQQKG